jgi:hypothetical protein
MKNNIINKEGGLVKMIIIIVIALAILSWYGVDIKDFFTSPQMQENLGHIWNFIKDLWSNYLTDPAHKLWGIWFTYVWGPFLNVIK